MVNTSSAPLRWRSLLFVPAHQERFVAKAHERGADAVILDIEDAVPDAEKPAARAALPAAVASIARGAAPMVRVNRSMRKLVPDLEAAVIPGVVAIVLPKVDSAAWVVEVAETVRELERERGLPVGGIKLILQIEGPGALPHLPAIASADPSVAAMSIGPEDYSATLGGEPCADLLYGPNLALLQAARAAGIMPLGFIGSIADFSDLDAFRAVAAQAARLGFMGAMAIHPTQVTILNAAFTPSPERIAWAKRVIAADIEARAAGAGAFRLDGKMIDPPVVARARDIVAAAGEA